MKKYLHNIVVLLPNGNNWEEKTFSIIDNKDDLTERQLKNRIEKKYEFRPESIIRHEVMCYQ